VLRSGALFEHEGFGFEIVEFAIEASKEIQARQASEASEDD
jgi:hypothetical protein